MRLGVAAMGLGQRRLNIPRLGLAAVRLIETDLQLSAKGVAKKAASLWLLDKNVDLVRLVVLDFDQSPGLSPQGSPHFVGKLR